MLAAIGQQPLQQPTRILDEHMVEQFLRQPRAARDALLEGGSQQVRRLMAVAVDNESRAGRDSDSRRYDHS